MAPVASAEADPAVARHQPDVVCPGGGLAAASPRPSAPSAVGGSSVAASSAAALVVAASPEGCVAPALARAARRARAWYSGPCLRGSAYSFGLIVQ